MRIVFLGTPDFAVASLRALVKAEKDVVGVITAPDKPAGRGHKLRPSAVKVYAESMGLPLLQPNNLKDPEFLDALRGWQADLQIVVAFRMLPEVVWNMPPMGTFNLHGSLLPQYRGAAPINRAVMNGESKTGVTTFLLKHAIDTGNILMRHEEPIHPDDTAGSVHDRLMEQGADLVVKTVTALEAGDLEPQDQTVFMEAGEVLHEAPKLFKEDCRINWTNPVANIQNQIRGLSPYPGAFTTVRVGEKELQLKIYSSRLDIEKNSSDRKLIREGQQLGVTLPDGTLWLEEVQLEGKRRMQTADFLRGLNQGLDIVN